MSNINNEMIATAELAIKRAKEQFDQELDYTEQSLLRLEHLLIQAHQQFTILAQDDKKKNEAGYHTAKIWGSYLGEYLRHKWGGNWTERNTERFLIITGIELSPIAFVYQRITSLSDYSIEKYMTEIALLIQKGNTNDATLTLDGKKQEFHTSVITSTFIGLLSLSIVALIFFGAWLFYRMNLLEKSLTKTQNELVIMQTDLTNLQSEQTIMQTNISNTRSGMTLIQTDLSNTSSALASTINTLTYVQGLAENANRYAHSHNIYSDSRLKIDVTEIKDSLDGILSLRGVHFFWNTSEYPDMGLNDELQIGFIAQEVRQVYPELVSTDENGFMTVDYAKLIPVLVEAIKQQQLMIVDLQQQIIELQQNSK